MVPMGRKKVQKVKSAHLKWPPIVTVIHHYLALLNKSVHANLQGGKLPSFKLPALQPDLEVATLSPSLTLPHPPSLSPSLSLSALLFKDVFFFFFYWTSNKTFSS